LGRWTAATEVVLIFLLFFLYAGGPPPDVNEAHYLGKAKHFWNRDWCPDDHFLESADAHLVFYWTFGWLTKYLSLPATAWVGRILTWSLMAWAWRRLSVALVPRPLFSAVSAALFLLFSGRCHMAGEWVVGGVEAKGFAYVLVFFALAELVHDRWNRVWVALGAASAFHALVGGWAVVAAGVSWLWMGKHRPPWQNMLPALLVGLLLALPGLIPVLQLDRGVEAAVMDLARRIHVFQRLSHHLLLRTFEPLLIVRFAAMLAGWIVLCLLIPAEPGRQRLRGFVLGAVVIAVFGAAVELATLRQPGLAASLMRFYWYRLSDAMLPVGAAIALLAVVPRLQQRRPVLAQYWLVAATFIAGYSLAEMHFYQRWYGAGDANHEAQPKKDADWQEVCRWIEQNTLPGDRFLTPRRQQTFKWYAGRSEVVSYKDMPQDARAVVQWQQRLLRVFGVQTAGQLGQRDQPLAEIRVRVLFELAKEYDFQYVLIDRTRRDVTRPHPHVAFVWQNDSFAIFQLRPPAVLDWTEQSSETRQEFRPAGRGDGYRTDAAEGKED